MTKNIRVDDPWTNKARKEGYLARSVYKLEEIDKKYSLFDDMTHYVLDIGCAPGSWLQYASQRVQAIVGSGAIDAKIIGFDIKHIQYNGPYVYGYEQDITDKAGVQSVLDEHHLSTFDIILSDMAPDTMGRADIDAIKSIGLIEKTLWIYDTYLKAGGKFVIKVFMGPGFDVLVRDLKEYYGASHIVTYKPKACRKESKEIYIIKRS